VWCGFQFEWGRRPFSRGRSATLASGKEEVAKSKEGPGQLSKKIKKNGARGRVPLG
jgi:hypothetical protein